ncbi:hypothetical protein HQ545_08340 [Candidatus Woesearchaeota archaeon]|nr:hypothetical protein [Candidatus Woesearchaeota archaeon]
MRNKIYSMARGRNVLRVVLQYVMFWPSLRNYVMIWLKYKPVKKKTEKKEKVVIIEE